MTVIETAPLAHPRLGRHAVVGIRPWGLVVPGHGEWPDVPLELADLRVIEMLAQGGTTDQVIEAPILALLAEHSLLVAPTGDPGEPPVPSGGLGLTGADRTASATETGPGEYVLPTPVLLGCGPGGFEYVDHDGHVGVRLSAIELVAVAVFRRPLSLDDADAAQQQELGDAALDRVTLADLLAKAIAGGLVVPFDPSDESHARETRAAEHMRDALRRMAAVHAEFDRIEAEHDRVRGVDDRTRVIGFHTNWASPPTSLGMVLAAALAADGGALRERYDFRPRLLWDRSRFEQAASGPPAIILFSNYVWSTPENLAHSALAKALDPRHITVHGGPDTPKYAGDVQEWFAAHPHIDIAVHGEGEATFTEVLGVLAEARSDDGVDLEALASVAGISYRRGQGAVQTEPRERIADLNTLPSPVLTGLFDGFTPAGGGQAGVILETNRGCPYGCTFCDWGSATLSRIRQFDIERVFAELDWCASHRMGLGLADANFGIFERDVEIASKIAELKSAYGYPRAVGNNYAKNTTKHLSKIIDIFTEAGIVAEGKMSMQSFDTNTLQTIRRKNIKVEKYHDLAVEFRRNRLPLTVELMMGLPGSSPGTFRADLQACIDRDLRVNAYPTVLLPNSPMNDPDYRRENGIVGKPDERLRRTATYDEDDFTEMLRLREAYYVVENFGVLRQVASYVRSETGTIEIDFYNGLIEATVGQPQRWPTATIALHVLPEMMVPPVSWHHFIDDVRNYLLEVVGIADDDALDTVLRVQHTLIPARGRRFPKTVELPHDFVAWHRHITARRDEGRYADWHLSCPPLRTFGPGQLTVTDPLNSCGTALGPPAASVEYFDSAWDMESPVSRPRQARPTEPSPASTASP